MRKDALPCSEDSLDVLTGASWFSTLDLTSGYNHLPVMEGDKYKTAFCTPFGLFEWKRMPFGLCNSPSAFQRLMQLLFCDQQFQSLLLYLDDIGMFSSFVEHLEMLNVVFGQMEQVGLKAKLEKSVFLQSEMRYLDHVISSNGVATDPSEVQAVVQS